MNIPETLEWWRGRRGRGMQLPTPPACERLMAHARAAGIPVGSLYVVSRPLFPGSLGTYDRPSGDLCCHYEAYRGEAGQREMLHCLLLLLAGVKLQFPVPQTTEEEWEQVRQAAQEAYTLAQQWGQAAVFSAEDLHRLLTQAVQRAFCQHAASLLAGHRSPSVARHAAVALQARRCLLPGLSDDERFEDALSGVSADEQANDALVDFDRSILRAQWVITSTRPQGEPATFGACALPLFPRSAQVLRVALARVASHAPADEPHPGLTCGSDAHFFRQVGSAAELEAVLRLVNGWFIDTSPQAALRLHCWVYGDALSMVAREARLYRLFLIFEDARQREGPRVLPPVISGCCSSHVPRSTTGRSRGPGSGFWHPGPALVRILPQGYRPCGFLSSSSTHLSMIVRTASGELDHASGWPSPCRFSLRSTR